MLHLDQKPRAAIADHDEVDFPLFLVAEIRQVELPEAEVGPALDGLEQVASHERLGPFSDVTDQRPVAEVPLRFLPQTAGHIGEPRLECEPKIEARERFQPATGRVHRHADQGRELAENHLVSRMRLEIPDERLDLTEFVDLGEVTDVLAHELLAAERRPPPREASIALREGLRKATVLPQRFPFLLRDPAR